MCHRAFQSTWARCQAQRVDAVAVGSATVDGATVDGAAGVAQAQRKTVVLTVVLMLRSAVCEIAKSH